MPMKIIHVINHFDIGGSEQIAVNIAIGFAKKGHKCCVIAVRKPSNQSNIGKELKARLQRHNVEFFEFGGPNIRTNLLYCPFQLRYFFWKWKPDIIHSHVDYPDLMVSLATRLSKFKIARTIQNCMLWGAHPWVGWVSESGLRDDLIVSVSDGASAAYNQLRAKYQLPASTHRVKIHNSIAFNGEATSFDHSDLVKQIRAEKGKHLFCFAGRFTHQKGFDILLDSLEKMPDSYKEKIKIYAFGDGEEREIYLRRIKEKQLPVAIHPAIAGVQGIFPEFDAVLMPSRYEGFSLVSLEASAGGVPVIGTTAPGQIETYPPDWPLTVPVDNSDALSSLIIKFTDGAFDIGQLKTIAGNWGKRFTISRMVNEYEKAYHDYLNSSTSIPCP